jgi:hypothetical protein
LARYALALGPSRILLTADAAIDLRFENPEVVRSTTHSVLAFTWQKVPVRILLNRFNHLPDAVETTQQFYDFWFFWGDVRQRVYLDNWKLSQGIEYPTNLVEERNGNVWRSTQALNVEFNVPFDDGTFRMDSTVAGKSLAARGGTTKNARAATRCAAPERWCHPQTSRASASADEGSGRCPA